MFDKNGIEIFDLSLTPENAKKRGYRYIDDIIYKVFPLSYALDDILKLVHEDGYKLGKPSSINDFDLFYGLYAPLEK